jgi:serine/threonine-protein kinase
MELDDMKAAWQELDRGLSAQTTQNLHMFKAAKFETLRYGLRPLAWGQAVQIVVGLMVALWGGSFWIDNRDVPHLLVAGLIVHIAGVSMIVFGALVETFIARIDYSAPVLTIQRQLTQLRKVYVRGGLLAGLPWWVVWVPSLMVVLKTRFGADLYVDAPEWVWINVAVGFLGMLLSWRFIGWAAKRPVLGKRLGDAAAGGSINRAQARLDEIAFFEKE